MLLDLPIKPILALDFSSLLAIFFVLFSLFGFISNLLKKLGGDEQQNVRGPQPRQRPGELQGEIDDFLKEVLGGNAPQKPKPKPKSRPTPKQQTRGHHEVDNVPERRRFEESQAEVEAPPDRREQARPRSPQPQRRASQQTRKRTSSKPASAVFEEEPRPTKSLKDRHLVSSLDSHVETYMQSHLDDNRDEGVLPTAHTPITSGSLLAGGLDDVQQEPDFAAEIHQLLSSPSGMRQMIVANEVLSKPKALR